MTSKWMLEPIDKEKAKQQWNELMKRRTTIRKLNRQYPSGKYTAKLEVYKLFFQINKELCKIIVQYLKGQNEEKKGGTVVNEFER